MMFTFSAIQDYLLQLKQDSSFQHNVQQIKPGRFKRDPNLADYQARLIYTEQLRLFIYNPVALNLIFSNQELKTLFFYTFGYQGQTSFTIYPSAWLRDLPLLSIGAHVYFGDDIVLGTNQVSPDQSTIAVGSITIGEKTIFDQKCAVGLNSNIGEECTIGFRTSIALKAKIGRKVIIQGETNVGHSVKIGEQAIIGQCVNIGNFTVIEPGTHIEDHTKIPPFSHVSEHGITPRRRRQKELKLF